MHTKVSRPSSSTFCQLFIGGVDKGSEACPNCTVCTPVECETLDITFDGASVELSICKHAQEEPEETDELCDFDPSFPSGLIVAKAGEREEVEENGLHMPKPLRFLVSTYFL